MYLIIPSNQVNKYIVLQLYKFIHSDNLIMIILKYSPLISGGHWQTGRR